MLWIDFNTTRLQIDYKTAVSHLTRDQVKGHTKRGSANDSSSSLSVKT